MISPALDYAINSKHPQGSIKSELDDVFYKNKFKLVKPNNFKNELRFIDAISTCLMQKMEKDDKILIMGQDIAEYGGVFKAIK